MVEYLAVESLHYAFDVRKQGNELDAVERLTAFLKNGGQVPPIIINQRNGVIDGRHRLEAHKRAGLLTIAVIRQCFNDRNTERIFAVTKQLGGAAPLTSESIRWNMEQLFEGGASREAVVDAFSVTLTPAGARRYIEDVKSHMSKKKVNKCITLIQEGLPIAEAVKLSKAAPKSVDLALSKLTNANKGKDAGRYSKANMGNTMAPVSRRFEDQYKYILAAVNDGDMGPKMASGLVGHSVKLLHNAYRRAVEAQIRISQVLPREE